RVPQAGDLVRHLVPRKLAALARLRALRHLDLQLFGERRVLGRDAEAAGRDLLDPRVALGAETLARLAALARVRARTDPVERGRHGLVRLRGERAVRHAAAREAPEDGLDRLDAFDREIQDLVELEQVARLEPLASGLERRVHSRVSPPDPLAV